MDEGERGINQHTRRTFASSKVSRSVFSDSPDIPETIEGAEMLINGTLSSYQISSALFLDVRRKRMNDLLQPWHSPAEFYHTLGAHAAKHHGAAELPCAGKSRGGIKA
jgi:hypothetical protein